MASGYSNSALRQRFYPEAAVGGFSRHDSIVAFYTRVNALIRPDDHVLDLGAGRGSALDDDKIPARRALATLQGKCAHVEGCDIDPEVLENPYLDGARVSTATTLPYEDARFDLVVARHVLEHVEQPDSLAAEIMRVLKPGGWFCAVTPNRFGYIAFAARLVPNRLHQRALASIQPERKAEDVFPTQYLMNTRRDLQRQFGAYGEVILYRHSGEPTYHLGHPLVYRLTKLVHRFLPDALRAYLYIFVRKQG